jgi:hypothetical protein
MMAFDGKISETVRKAFADGQRGSLYVMVPADDGGHVRARQIDSQSRAERTL